MKDEKKHWLDHPRTPDRVLWGLVVVCALLLVGEGVLWLLHFRHGHFGFDARPLFYGAFGFVAFALIVLSGKYLRKLLMRDEDYYDR